MVIQANLKLNFIGGGKMAEAIINGVLTKKLVTKQDILLYIKSRNKQGKTVSTKISEKLVKNILKGKKDMANLTIDY